MAGPFVADVSANRGFESGFGGVGREERADIGFFAGKEAIAEFPVGGEAEAVAIEAEGFADGGDEAEAVAVWEAVLGGGGAGVGVGHGFERAAFGLNAAEHFGGGEDLAAGPEFLGIERHELDEADFHLAFAGKADERDKVIFRDAFDGNGVQLDFLETGGAGGFDAGEDARKVVAAGDLVEAGAVERVEVDIEAAESGGVKRLGVLLEEDGVGGEGQVLDAADGAELFDELAAGGGAGAARLRSGAVCESQDGRQCGRNGRSGRR